jgi:nucleotide-binding universal stress UspA family protein
MKQFQKILVPVDFSACSAEAVRVAADLSQRYTAEVTLVNVFEPMTYTNPEGYPFYLPGQFELLMAEHKKALAKATQEAEAAGALHVKTEQLEGSPTAEIVGYARVENFDLIVIGTHGRTGFKHALLGSVAERVARTATCPVLTVHAAAA